MKILTINGIESDGSGSTDLMGGILRSKGFDVVDVNQPIRHAWNARNLATVLTDAQTIVKLSEDGDCAVCHSYGGLKTIVAMYQRRFRAVYMFRPAVDRSFPFPDGDINVTCIYSKGDLAVWSGGLFLRLHHPFGWAGTLGFKDERIKNIRSSGLHSADFRGSKLRFWADYIERDLS